MNEVAETALRLSGVIFAIVWAYYMLRDMPKPSVPSRIQEERR